MEDSAPRRPRSYAFKAAWRWWVWNPGRPRERSTEAWADHLTRPEPNAHAEAALRYSTASLLMVNGQIASQTGGDNLDQQYPELSESVSTCSTSAGARRRTPRHCRSARPPPRRCRGHALPRARRGRRPRPDGLLHPRIERNAWRRRARRLPTVEPTTRYGKRSLSKAQRTSTTPSSSALCSSCSSTGDLGLGRHRRPLALQPASAVTLPAQAGDAASAPRQSRPLPRRRPRGRRPRPGRLPLQGQVGASRA